ncbi:MAG: c-type cytochrome [Archangium sp.]|nr:c-type cytochrome [Archangium sp.]
MMNRLTCSAVGAVLATATLAVTAMGCAAANEIPSAQRGSGSLALSQDDKLLYAVDTDNSMLVVVDTVSNQKVAEVKVGPSPSRVLVGADDTIYVANRGSNFVSVIRRGEWSEAQRLEVGMEPTGLAMTADGKQLLVVSATSPTTPDFGVLTVFDTASLQPRFEIPVGGEPRAVAAIKGNRALVSLLKQGQVIEVDLSNGQLVGANNEQSIYSLANATSLGSSSTSPSLRGPSTFSTFRPRAMTDLIATPDGTRVFAPVVWAREDAIARRPNSAGGYYSAGGPCNVGAVATAGIVTVDTNASATPRVDDLTNCFSSGTNSETTSDFPTTAISPSSSFSGFPGSAPNDGVVQGPTVGVVDPTGSWLFVVNRESSNVAVMPTYRRTGSDLKFNATGSSIRGSVNVGAGADGIAITNSGLTVYVYSQFDHVVDVLGADGVGEKAKLTRNAAKRLKIAEDTLAPELAAGRRLFFDALDTRMSSAQTNVACATCHLEGREDGHVWQFPDGPRQTPALAGRKLLSTAPYHWSGEFDDLSAFNAHTIIERMGGSGLARAAADTLDQWVDQLPVAPTPIRPELAEVQRGKQIFETKAECATCHTGELRTNNQFASVGTVNARGANPDNGRVLEVGFNVPSLLGVSRSAPYLHDGAEKTLEQRVFANQGNTHGKTAELTSDEKSDLVAYLKSL